MDTNKILNGAYHSAVLSGLIMTNSMLAKNILKVKPTDLGQIDLKNGTMLFVNVYIAMMVKQALINNGILPPSINPPA